jgi:MOSC domain-containing protein YiiM
MSNTKKVSVISIHVGLPRQFDASSDGIEGNDKPWISGIVKTEILGPVMIRRSNLDGDGQADLVHHGGADKAVLAYPLHNYSFWKTEFPGIDWKAGCFGENLTIEGQCEPDVCVGDIYAIGGARLQVSQPRQPCWKLSKRWSLPKLAVRVQQTRLTGWYYRVIEEGVVQAGDFISLVDRPYDNWTISHSNEMMFGQSVASEEIAAFADCPLLSDSWRKTLSSRAAKIGKAMTPSDNEQRRLFRS